MTRLPPSPRSPGTRLGLDAAREQVARALGAIRARDVATNASNTTLEIAILEAVVDLDSEQTSAVDTLGAGNMIEHDDDGNVRAGQLQRLAVLESIFFGDESTGQVGLLDTLLTMQDPENEAVE